MKDDGGPGLYKDIAWLSRAFLYRDYVTDHKFSITTFTSDGAAITSSGVKKGDQFLGDVTINQLRNKNILTDLKVDTDSNVFATITVGDTAPGLTAVFSFTVPDQRSGKVELQYRHQYTGITTGIEMTANPLVNFSGLVGTTMFSVGTDVSFDTATGKFTKLNAGFNYNNGAGVLSSVTLNDKGDSLVASYWHFLGKKVDTSVGAEMTHSFSTNENTLTIGTQHRLDWRTNLLGKVDTSGKVSAAIEQEFYGASRFTISGEVDTKAIEKTAKVGLALCLIPRV